MHAQQPNMAEFTVDDGSGLLRVRFFVTEGEAQERALKQLQVDAYARGRSGKRGSGGPR